MRPSRAVLVGLVRLLVGAYPRWVGISSPARGEAAPQRIYFANHTSHIDTLAIWSALPPALRRITRPVAAKDYWGAGGFRRYIATKGFNALLVERLRVTRGNNPLQTLFDALESGDSLIIFPEGTRGTEALPAPFKSGLFHLATKFPGVDLIPVYLENLNRAMPKGHLPVPIACTVRFGAPLTRIADEGRDEFLQRARAAVVELA